MRLGHQVLVVRRLDGDVDARAPPSERPRPDAAADDQLLAAYDAVGRAGRVELGRRACLDVEHAHTFE